MVRPSPCGHGRRRPSAIWFVKACRTGHKDVSFRNAIPPRTYSPNAWLYFDEGSADETYALIEQR